jgi:hypothetical protein
MGAWRGPRVLVPVVVDALPVSATEATTSIWSSVAIDPLVATAARPSPFDTFTGRPAGVHLHWALPDGLTRGARAAPPPDAPLAAGTNAAAEQPEAEDTSRTEFPAIPNRWLVARIVAGATAASPKTATAWVIESALDPARRRVTPLATWREDRTDEPPPPITAMGPGEPTFAVYYDNTKNVLAFHDPLSGVASGPITYLVTGWFSEPTRDPLHAPSTESAWHAALQRLGWSLSVASLERLDAAAREFLRGQRELGLKSKEEESGPVFRPAPSSTSTNVGDVSASTAEATMRIGAAASRISKALGVDVLLSRQRYFEQHWPRQLLCHGAVFDVAWNGRGGGFDTADAGVPRADAVKVAVGNSGAQALGAPIDTATPLTDAVGCTYEIQGSPTVIAFQFTDQAHWNEAHTESHPSIDLGDEAIYTTDAETGLTVFNVRQGSTYLTVVVNVEPGGAKTAIDVGTAVVGYVLS